MEFDAGPNMTGTGNTEDGRKRERKERYLDSLMDKAGELSLRCGLF